MDKHVSGNLVLTRCFIFLKSRDVFLYLGGGSRGKCVLSIFLKCVFHTILYHSSKCMVQNWIRGELTSKAISNYFSLLSVSKSRISIWANDGRNVCSCPANAGSSLPNCVDFGREGLDKFVKMCV